MKLSANFKRTLAMMLPYKGRIAMALIGMILTAATEPALAGLLKLLLDRGFATGSHFSLWLVPLCVIGIFAIRGMSTFTTSYMMAWVSGRQLSDLRQQIFLRILNVPISFYASHSVGKIINSMMSEVQQILDMIRNILTALIRDSLTVLGLLGYLFWLNWQLTMVALIIIPAIAMVIRLTAQRLKRLIKEFQSINGELTQVIEETTRAQQVIKVFGSQSYEAERFGARANKLRGFAIRMASTMASTMPITQIITSFAVSLIIVIALVQARNGQMSLGEFVSFITAMLMILTPLKHLAGVNGPLQRGMAAADVVFALIDSESERTNGRVLSERAAGRLEFSHVHFAYPGQQQAALSDISLDIAPGETIALVGMSGGGKSTLVNLVPEFYAPDQGEIRLDGIPLSEIALTSLRAQIAMVSQNVVLFDDTIAANIAYGDAAPDRARIEHAAKAAYLTAVIDALPQGLETLVGYNGNRLSGGQRQRLAIARAIYKDAPILILDEATSALDTESERAVQAALDNLMQGRTTLVIAHRLSTIEHADRIAVLKAGQIVEIGTHGELLARNGVYAHLYHLQFAPELA